MGFFGSQHSSKLPSMIYTYKEFQFLKNHSLAINFNFYDCCVLYFNYKFEVFKNTLILTDIFVVYLYVFFYISSIPYNKYVPLVYFEYISKQLRTLKIKLTEPCSPFSLPTWRKLVLDCESKVMYTGFVLLRSSGTFKS